jgi:hypothetical protein
MIKDVLSHVFTSLPCLVTERQLSSTFMYRGGVLYKNPTNRGGGPDGDQILSTQDISDMHKDQLPEEDTGLDGSIMPDHSKPEAASTSTLGDQHELLSDLTSLLEEGLLWSNELEQHGEEDVTSSIPSVIQPTQEQVDRFAQMERWSDDPTLQQDNMEEARRNLGIPKDSDPPKIPGMRPNVALQPYRREGLRKRAHVSTEPEVKWLYPILFAQLYHLWTDQIPVMPPSILMLRTLAMYLFEAR